MSSRSAFRAAIRSERPTPSRANPSASLRHRAAGASRRLASSVPSSKLLFASDDDDSVSGRVRVSVRLRPRNAEDLASDADFADCVELQPELKRLILRKNNWSSESYKFDEVFTESASQKRVYEAVAKPIVESVLDGYNGTVMAYGQTGTGKTFTMGRVGREDPSESGIMVRAVEDILAATTLTSDTVSVSYLQLYIESIEDLLGPAKSNISIVEDPKTGEVFLRGVEVVKIRDIRQFLQILEIGEANRHAANTKLNAESSRSHAILMIYIERSVKNVVTDISSLEDHRRPNLLGSSSIPTVLKSKLLIVDLAGSERINKSGSEGHTLEEAKFINLSLTSLGKCINALAENSSHIPTRDSKLTRLLSDSFGGSARTSLIVTIGPSARHHTETSSTIMFGQRAMKVVNMLKLKEQFDYESFCWKLQHQVDHLISELERSEKLRDSDKQKMGKIMEDSQVSLFETTKSFNAKYELLEKENIQLKLEIKDLLVELNHEKERNDLLLEENTRLELNMTQNQELQLENSTYQKVLAETTQMYEKKISELMERIEYEKGQCEIAKEELVLNRIMIDEQRSLQLQNQKERKQLEVKCEELCSLHEEALTEVQYLKEEKEEILSEKAMLYEEIHTLTEELSNEEKLRKALEDEVFKLQRIVSDFNNGHEAKTRDTKDENDKVASGFESPKISQKNNHPQLSSGQNGRVPKFFEEVGLQKLLASLKSKDEGVKIHAVKVIANLAAEDLNQEKIVQEGGLDALLSLLGSSQNLTIYRVASGAIANLAMNEINQCLIVSKGGVQLLANIASNAADPQILRMVAGAIANLCGNERLHSTLIEDGGTKALSNMLRCQHAEVIAQVARGLANFAKCESRGISQGRRKGRSVLIEDGALGWLLTNSATDSHSIRRHIELALCHLAQNEDNAQDFVATGAVKQLVRISRESSKEDIRDLAKKTLNRSSIFLAEIQRDWQNL